MIRKDALISSRCFQPPLVLVPADSRSQLLLVPAGSGPSRFWSYLVPVHAGSGPRPNKQQQEPEAGLTSSARAVLS